MRYLIILLYTVLVPQVHAGITESPSWKETLDAGNDPRNPGCLGEWVEVGENPTCQGESPYILGEECEGPEEEIKGFGGRLKEYTSGAAGNECAFNMGIIRYNCDEVCGGVGLGSCVTVPSACGPGIDSAKCLCIIGED